MDTGTVGELHSMLIGSTQMLRAVPVGLTVASTVAVPNLAVIEVTDEATVPANNPPGPPPQELCKSACAASTARSTSS